MTVRGDRPMGIVSGSFGVQRTWDRWIVGDSLFAERNPEFYATPTDRVDVGDFTYGTYLRAFDPAVPTEESDYVYNLAFTEEDRVPSHLALPRVRSAACEGRRDPGTRSASRGSRRSGPGSSSATAWAPSTVVRGPGRRTRLSDGVLLARRGLAAARLQWRLFGPARRPGSRPRAHLPRRRPARDPERFKPPMLTAMAVNRDGSPARIAERQGSLVGFSFPAWQDTVEGRYAAGGFRDIGGLTLWKDGEYVGHNAWPSGQATIGEGTNERKVEVTQERTSRHDFWEIGRGDGQPLHLPDQPAVGRDHRCAADCPAAVRRSGRRAQPGPRGGRASRSASCSTARTATTQGGSGRSRRRRASTRSIPWEEASALALRLDRGPRRTPGRPLGRRSWTTPPVAGQLPPRCGSRPRTRTAPRPSSSR